MPGIFITIGMIPVFSVNIKGIHCANDYGNEGYLDYQGRDVQNNVWTTCIQEGRFLHTSYLQRSNTISKDKEIYYRDWKLKSQNLWDYRFPKDFVYPEVLYLQTPALVHQPWNKADLYRRLMQLKKIKRLWRK